MAKPVIACVVGTRPDAIKSAPVILELRKHSDDVETVVISTGQHREMLQQALATFGITPDLDLDIMMHGQSLSQVTSRSVDGLDHALQECKVSMVLAQGDTTSTFCAALTAFYQRLPFGHIEAGLRTPSVHEPFPEEFNRRAATIIAAQHYAPTNWARDNLAAENVPAGAVFVTGNTGIDAVQFVLRQGGTAWYEGHSGPVILLTTHRRENWGEPQRQIARAFRRLLERYPRALGVVPMHRNPDIRKVLTSELGSLAQAQLIEPPDYPDFVRLMQRSKLILTDSGGVQEEAPTLGVPVLVLRNTSERPEGIEAGCAALVGSNEDAIFHEASNLMESDEAYDRMSRASSPYGDGSAALRIRYRSLELLGVPSAQVPDWTYSKQSYTESYKD